MMSNPQEQVIITVLQAEEWFGKDFVRFGIEVDNAVDPAGLGLINISIVINELLEQRERVLDMKMVFDSGATAVDEIDTWWRYVLGET